MLLAALLLLSACGGRAAEADALREAVSALETENAALREQLDALQTQTEQEGPEENPIDRFFEAIEYDGTTLAMNAAAGCWADAWEAETRHLAEELRAQLPLEEDQELVDAYLAAAEEQAARMDVMAIYPVSDVSVPEPERIYSSGTLRGVLWAGGQAQIWKDTFYQLWNVLFFDYEFVFDAAAARRELADWLE